VTGSSAVTINTAAQAGARAAVGPIRVGEPSGLEVLAGGVMLLGSVVLILAVVHLAAEALWRGDRWR
jgi:hypothetical protein